jgi:hypothetical protein
MRLPITRDGWSNRTIRAWADLIGPEQLEQLRQLLRALAVALRGDDAGIY